MVFIYLSLALSHLPDGVAASCQSLNSLLRRFGSDLTSWPALSCPAVCLFHLPLLSPSAWQSELAFLVLWILLLP